MEKAITFNCENDQLVGICHLPEVHHGYGVLIIVGGKQYRAGSHRQFVSLARYLERNQIPVFRFDYRGMGDSSGEEVGFEGCEEDVKAAIDTFFKVMPGMRGVIIWGLCDAATVAASYCNSDSRVKGLVLLNPWVKSGEYSEEAKFKHHYASRFYEINTWKRILNGDVHWLSALFSITKLLAKLIKKKTNSIFTEEKQSESNLAFNVTQNLSAFNGKILIILSGDDLTATEFKEHVINKSNWSDIEKRGDILIRILKEANHTFALRSWKESVNIWTEEWIKKNF